MSPSAATLPADVPAKYGKGAKLEWDQRRRHRHVLAMLQRVSGEVLDYGCGYGDLTYAMSRTHPVQGVDVDPERIAFAAAEYAPIRFTTCEPGGLSFPDGSFDVVTSVAVIHFVPDPIRYLREIRRVLRSGGHLIIACRNQRVLLNGLRRLLHRPAPSKTQGGLWIPSRKTFCEILEREGFRIKADSHFYDPPLMGWKSLEDFAVGAVEQLLSLTSLRSTASFYVLLAGK